MQVINAKRAVTAASRAFYAKPTKIHALICRASSYTDLSKINAMLLMTFSKDIGKLERLEGIVTQQQKQIELLTATVQKVGDQVALNRPAPQLVANH